MRNPIPAAPRSPGRLVRFGVDRVIGAALIVGLVLFGVLARVFAAS